MRYALTGEEAREAFEKIAKANLSKSEQDEFNKKIQQVAFDMQIAIKKCELDSLPEFVKSSNSTLYTNELRRAPEPSPMKKSKEQNQFFKDIHQVTLENGSSFYVMLNGIGGRFVSDNWTKESIDKCAEMAAKLGGQFNMIPSGEPGSFPDHLRAYATQAYAKHGIHLPDPTPPTAQQIEQSRQRYEALEGSNNTQMMMKKELSGLRQEQSMAELAQVSDREQGQDKSGMTPFSIEPKPTK
ncbi:hypothetical protein [Legionella brunensis]|uniref:Uncharacterized protein n=1 Tax=Legionella brunensis TaxID=29422 RepID=A0A0W0SPJ9_9GAMM|nr:hypothetical protein [Legionella brunensis]KTC85220.1 hypothetical protein Lbru_1016 [Legionella brunensis]